MKRIAKIVAVAVALLGLGVARAQQPIAVEPRGPGPAARVVRDTLAGLALGAVVSGGVVGWEMGIDGDDEHDWEETLAWGAGVGLAAGVVWGIVDATRAEATYGRFAAPAPALAARDGNSITLDLRRSDQSRRVSFPVLRGRF